MNVVSIVQARMGSTRFPGKSLADLHGAPLLQRVLERIARCTLIDRIVVATTQDESDDELALVAVDTGFDVVRGSVEDVLDRYMQAAREYGADLIVRNTADEPFLDPSLIDECISTFASSTPDYVSNNLRPAYPEGLDTEVVSRKALDKAWQEATLASDREHVTPFIWRQPDVFRLVHAGSKNIHPEWRLTVDYPADLEFARACYRELPAEFSFQDVVKLLESRPDLMELCPSVPRREGYTKSVSNE